MKKKFFSTLYKNTLIIMIMTFIVRFIGMVTRLLETRMLGTSGIAPYTLTFPTILLFISLSGFCQNISVTKMVAEAKAIGKENPLLVLKASLKLTLAISIIVLIIYIPLSYIISIYLLKEIKFFYVLLGACPLILLVGPSDALRGYFTGIKNIKFAAISLLLEQLARSITAVIFIIIFKDINLYLVNFLLVISLSIGEVASIIYCLFKLKNTKFLKLPLNKELKLNLFNLSFQNTSTRMFGSLTYFLEPIIFTNIFIFLSYNKEDIHLFYTIIDAFTLPLLTSLSFLPQAICSASMPHLTEEYKLNQIDTLNNSIHKLLNIIIYPSVGILILIFFYSSDYMFLLYKTTNGAKEASMFAPFFLSYYIHSFFQTILQATSEAKKILKIQTFCNVLRLLLILGLSFIPSINLYSLILSTTMVLNLNCILLYYTLKKKINFKIIGNNLLSILLYTLFMIFLSLLLNIMSIPYYISTIILGLIIFLFTIYQKKKSSF